MTYALYLDDERTPKTQCPIGDEWVVVRSFGEAIDCLYDKGYPLYMSLDHDLGEGMKTGYDFVKWFVNEWMEDSYTLSDMPPFPYVNYHTANPVGRDNMKGMIDCVIECFDIEQYEV